MKTEQEQIDKMAQAMCGFCTVDKRCILKYSAPCIEVANQDCTCKESAEELLDAGYGDVSEYKAEIERLEVETDERISEKFVDTFEERQKTYNYAFSNGYSKGLSDSRTKIKQAQIDVLNRVKDIVFDYLGVKNIKEAEALSLLDSTLTYDVVTCGIDELIKEVQNEQKD